jgi:pimeloyl-ACP methyl ester carboxylesterase
VRVDHLAEVLRGSDSEFLHGNAQIGGVRLHYVQQGTGSKLVLLLHGFPQCWYAWRHQLKAFGEAFTVVAPDLRGYGLSDKPSHKSDYEISKLVDDVTGLIRHLGFSQATVVGHDWGASIAWAVALAYPEYVTKLVAMQVPPLDVWIKNLTVGQAMRSWYMLFFQLPYLPELWIRARNFYGLERMFKSTTVRPNVFTDADIAVYKNALREDGALTAAINYYRANFIRRFVKRGKPHKQETGRRISVPTLFLFGEQDFAIDPRTVRGVAEFIDAPYREIRFAQSGHWVQEELPLEVNRALVEFVEG